MTFNLTSAPWIPVRWLDGRSSSVGLSELFARAPEISDLAVPPHERVSILRLLVCIAQSSHGAPATPEDWEGWDTGLEAAVAAYLAKWKDHFELMGDGPRFLQSPVGSAPKKGSDGFPLAQLVFHFAAGNNPTLFDQSGDDKDPRVLESPFIARAVLTYQNHFVGGSLASKVKGNGPALKALHSFLIGRSLRETIVLNCIDQETLAPGKLGKPVWEGGSKNDYLARLVPLPCKLWLVDEGMRVRIGEGTRYDEYDTSSMRETSTTIVIRRRAGTESKVLLRASAGKGIWRDLHCIAVLQKGELHAPLIFRSHIDAQDDRQVSFWCGELIKDIKHAKIIDAAESVFTVPFLLFTPAGQNRYQAGVEFSESVAVLLIRAVKNYADALKPKPSRPQKDVAKDYPLIPSAKRHFWNSLDQQSGILLDLLKGLGTAADPMGSATFGEAGDPWTRAVRAAAAAAYEHCCPRQNPRQLQAYAAGLRVLRPLPKSTPAKPRKTAPAATDL